MIVVTGVNGFIGRHLLSTLVGSSSQVIGFDRSGQAPRSVLAFGHADGLMDWLEDPFYGPPGWRPKDARAIVHLGAITDTTCQDRALLWKYNANFTTRLWDWCAFNRKKLIYASSAATYGNGEYGFSDSDHVTRLLRPRNPYGQSKHAMDLHALDRAGVWAPPAWAGLKFFNVYGPGEGPKGPMASMVCHGARQAKESGEIRLFKGDGGVPDGGHRRDFVFVEDVVDVIMWALGRDEPMGILNVGAGEARTFNDLAKAVFSAAGVDGRVSYMDMPEALRPQYQDFTMADVSKLRSLGYRKPFVTLEEGVARTVGRGTV
jgi:ADP-L-glycero-D-manno-heptose 6-epimerase